MLKVIRLGTGSVGDVFVRIEADGGRLSFSGVEGPLRNGNARGSCGQIVDCIELKSYAPGWDAESVEELLETWRRWHLNDMRAGCAHQRAAGWGEEEVEVVSYKLTSEALELRKEAEAKATAAAVAGEVARLDPTERALLACDWWRDVFQPPDADSPLSGCYEVEKRERKQAGWVREGEHSRGVLSKPCPECGYKYGTSWLREEVPPEVLAYLEALPDADREPAWS